MSEEEVLDVLECTEEFNILSSDSEASNDDALPSLFPPRKRLRPISDEESTRGTEPSSPSSNQRGNESEDSDNSSNIAVNIPGLADLHKENNAVQRSEQGMEDATVSSETLDPFNFSSEGEEEEEEKESETEEDGDEYAPKSFEEPESSDEEDYIDIKTVSNLFKKKLKKFGISQRMAAKHILKCSQSNLSDLFSKAAGPKTSKDLTHRGKQLYFEMQKWLSSEEKQNEAKRKCTQQRAYGCKTTEMSRGKGKTATRFSPVQLAVLLKLYKKDNRPSSKKQQLIAETLNVDTIQIRTWFNNQRARNFPAGKDKSVDSIPDDLDSFVNNY